MHIELRKIGGRLEAFFCHDGGGSFGTGATAGAVQRFLLSPLVFALLLIAVAVAACLAHPAPLLAQDHAHGLGLGLAAMGTVNLREWRAKRANLATEMRAITDKAETEKRQLNTEEDTRFKALFKEQDELRQSIEREEQVAEVERSLAEERSRNTGKPDAPAPKIDSPEGRANPRASEEYRSAFSSFICRGFRGMSPDEQRALAVGSDTGGGFTVAAEQFVAGLIKAVDNVLWIRQLATKQSVPTAQSLGVMTLDTDPDDADWTSELATGNEDSAMAFGKRKMIPHPLAKLLKVSNDFLRQTMSGGEALVRDRLAYKFGVAQEKGFMTGTGVQQALGIFTASSDGITTARDVSTGNTTTSIQFDGLLTAKYSLKQQYQNDPSLRWVFHRDAVAQIAKLKDGDGQYLWRESVRAGEPDRILNLPLAMSEYAPNTFTTGLYVGALGVFSYYWIADAYDMAIKRLDELYAVTNQTGFIGRQAVDGQPVLAEAFARVKLA